MTAEQYRIENCNYKISDGDNIENLMQEYAKMKCQELLDIIVKNAKVENECYPITPNNIETIIYTHHDGNFYVNKDSILNAVDLDSFID